jgi:predicted PurR-regulated permease PerM
MRKQATLREPERVDADVSTVVSAARLSGSTPTRVPLAIATLLLFVAAAWVAAPLWVGLMLGTVMAFTAQPLHERLSARFGQRTGAAAVVTTLLGGLAMACGGAVALFVVAREVVKIVSVFQRRLASGSSFDLLGARATQALSNLGVEPNSITMGLRSELGKLSSEAAATAGLILQTTAGALLTLVVALWTMYYALLGWPGLARRLELLLPLKASDVRALTREFRDVGRSAFVATLGCAVVQGILAAIGFALAGVPEPVTWSVLLAITSFVPVIGTGLVWLPAGFYLVATGHPARGVFEWVWGALVVMAATDYVIRPALVGKKGHTHPLLTLISLIGGVLAFGLPGLVAGPLIVSLFAATLRIYERDVALQTPSG